jgi:hypothetical protein
MTWLALFLTVSLKAQAGVAQNPLAPPDFSGRWLQIVTDGRPGASEIKTIKQNATQLSISGSSSPDEVVVCYLDGRELRRQLGGLQTATRATWQERSLVVSTVTTFPGNQGASESIQTWRIDAVQRLVIDARRPSSTSGTVMVFRRQDREPSWHP